jgi:hypothetical protein
LNSLLTLSKPSAMATIGMRKPRKATKDGSGALGVVNRRKKTNGSSLTMLRTSVSVA